MSPNAVVEVNDPSLLCLNGALKQAMDGLPKRTNATKPSAGEILTRADVEQIFMRMNMEYVTMLQGIETKYDEALLKKDDEIKTLKEQTIKQHLSLEKSQQYQNRDSLKICGLREPTLGNNEREDTDTTVTKFFEKANIPVPKQELSMTHRLPSRESTRSKPLLVKLRSRIVRNSVMRMKKQMRDNELLKGEYPDVFIVEHLTPMRSKVAYKLRHDPNIEKVWSIDGRLKVVLKGATTDKPITVDSLSQLTQIPGWTKEDIEKLVFEA